MKYEDAVAYINKYINSSRNAPLIVVCCNLNDVNNLISFYSVGNNIQKSANNFCKKDEFPNFEELHNYIINNVGVLFITNLSEYMKLKGRKFVKQQLHLLLKLNTKLTSHTIIITHQCDEFIKIEDPRMRSSYIKVDGNKDVLPSLVFLGLDMNHENSLTGIDNLYEGIKGQQEKIYIKTAKTKEIYPLSLLKIECISSSYDLLVKKFNVFMGISEKCGTNEQWDVLYNSFQNRKNINDIVNDDFGGVSNLRYAISNFYAYDKYKQWLYFISLKLCYGRTDYLGIVVKKSESLEEFVVNLFNSLLDIDHLSSQFNKLYEERKFILKNFLSYESEIYKYCKLTIIKEKNALYYLTDNSRQEKEAIIYYLDKYGEEFACLDLLEVLRKVCPDIASYLSLYDFKNEFLTKYFQQYKYQKLINRIYPEFRTIVEEQAYKRDYNMILSPRSSKVEKMIKEDSILYFVDALGVEYLSYIVDKCKECELNIKIDIARSELPSITCQNKEFVTIFKEHNIPVVDIKELDNLKHHGTNNYDYQLVKQPVYLVEELNIIDKLIKQIKVSLTKGNCKHAVIISDHGASRLAVISETENKLSMHTKGEHSGRCCPVSDIDEKPEFATEENNFWVLANYDRFMGSRKANVEVHGGATLEEVVVPLIEITNQNNSHLDVKLIEKEILVSFRKKAVLKLFVSEKLPNIRILLNNKYYDAQPTNEELIFSVELSDIKRANNYVFDVYSGDNVIAENLEMVVKKEGVEEKDLF